MQSQGCLDVIFYGLKAYSDQIMHENRVVCSARNLPEQTFLLLKSYSAQDFTQAYLYLNRIRFGFQT